MVIQWLKLFLYYSIFLLVLSPLYFLALFVGVMATDSGTDEAQQTGSIILHIGIFLVTAIPCLISLMIFKDIRAKVKLIMGAIFIIVIELILYLESYHTNIFYDIYKWIF
ncbi:hypothetical protein ACIQD3_04635 [Peribacillus loiseleuriae]|uniref:hypothetical protein n=1 Tax=Peribacillus loiseleuriae TaxID=1679170 RepID=UPI0037F14838